MTTSLERVDLILPTLSTMTTSLERVDLILFAGVSYGMDLRYCWCRINRTGSLGSFNGGLGGEEAWDKMEEDSAIIKERSRDDETLESSHRSQADWIQHYVENQKEAPYHSSRGVAVIEDDNGRNEDLFDVMVVEEEQGIMDNLEFGVDQDDIFGSAAANVGCDMTKMFPNQCSVFETHKEATTFIKNLGVSVGVVIIKTRSELSGKRTPFIEYKCEREGVHRYHCKGGKYVKSKSIGGKNKPRETETNKCGCPFRMKCSMDRLSKKWSLTLLNVIHNHQVVRYGDGHAILGRLSQEEKEDVDRMSKNRILPKYILNELRTKDPSNVTQSKQVYNMRAYQRMKEREGRSVMQQVFYLADKNNSFIDCRSVNDTVIDIFWPHKDSMTLGRCFPSVMLMDCTYKTNGYDMPLLQVVGVTLTGKTFPVGFALLGFEREDNYTWALQKLRDVPSCKMYSHRQRNIANECNPCCLSRC